jgi:mannose-6-phosphate isomerase-like protein (cupin superfamily)
VNRYEYFDVCSLNMNEPRPSKKLLDGLKGCCSGITFHTSTEYGEPGVHEDQEGFFVVEGTGFLNMDGEEIPVKPDTVIILPPGVAHTFKRNPDSVPLKIFWYHAAV